MDNVGMSDLNDTSDKLSSRPEEGKLSRNKSEIINSKEESRITEQFDKFSIYKSAQENKSKSFDECSGPAPHLDDDINSGGDRKRPPALYQGNAMKLGNSAYGDSNNREDRSAKARDVCSSDSSTRAKGLNGTLDTRKVTRNDTKFKSKGGNITAKTNVSDGRRSQNNDDQNSGKHVYDSEGSCDSDAGIKSTRGSETANSDPYVPIEHNFADQHDSNIMTTNAISSKVKAHDTTRSGGKNKIDVKVRKDIKEHRGSIDEYTVPSNSSPKYTNGGSRSKNESCRSSLNNRSGTSVPNKSISSGVETRRHYDEETSEVRKNGDSSNSEFSVCNSDSSRSSSSSGSSRSGKNSNSENHRSSSSHYRTRNIASDSSRSNSPRGNRTSGRSNSRNGMSSRNRSQSSREGSVNSLNRLAETGAIPRKRDGLTEVHSGRRKNKRRVTDNTTSVVRNNSESNTSSRLISEGNCRNSRSRTNNRIQEGKRECSRRSDASTERFCPETVSDSSTSEDDDITRKNEPNHVNKSKTVAKESQPSYHLNHPKSIAPKVHLEYEWQYRDDQGGWVTYGQSGGNAPGSKMVTSEDIEKYYTEDPDKTPLLIEFNNNKYILDFQKMKQTSQRTAHQRDIRRILKLPENKNSSQNNPSRGRLGIDYPMNAGDGRTNQVVRYDSNTAAETNAGRSYTGNSAKGRDDPSLLYEWQFKDEHGKWIAYGKANAFFDKSNATTSRSEDIEKAYSNKHNMPYFFMESSLHSYMLDFEHMVQINNQTQVERKIRRVVKESSTKDSLVKSVGKFFENLTGQKHKKKQKNEFTTPYEWQFLDEHGVWIAYGQTNSAGNVVCTTNTTSDDIQEYVSLGLPKERMTINSAHNTYRLDFHNLTQTNTRTFIQRPIRRVLKNNRDDSDRNYNRNTAEVSLFGNQGSNSAYVAPGRTTNKSVSTHLWQFEDVLGQWITYGESCSTVTGPFTTNAGSDDIEEYFLKNNGERPMFVRNIYNDYILDFQTMLQTNQSTSVQRRIRRVTKPNEITRNHRR